MRQESNPQAPRRETDLQSAALTVRPRMRKIFSPSRDKKPDEGGGREPYARAALVPHKVLRFSNNKRSGSFPLPCRKPTRSFKSPKNDSEIFGSGQRPLPRLSKLQVMAEATGPLGAEAREHDRSQPAVGMSPAYRAQTLAGGPPRAANHAAGARRVFGGCPRFVRPIRRHFPSKPPRLPNYWKSVMQYILQSTL